MARKRTDASEKVIYEKVAYCNMPDVPYELDETALVVMQKLERGLHYLLDNLDNYDMTMEDVAEYAGYSPGYFKAQFSRHFEMPFWQFVTKLRMRQAAREICDKHYPSEIASRYGFSNSASFSKAFRREIGISPRQFYKGNYLVPDMPLRNRLGGMPLSLEYTIERAIILMGPTAQPPHGAQTYFMDALALPFSRAYPQFDELLKAGTSATAGDFDCIGVWNYHPTTNFEYVFGPIAARLDSISPMEPLPEPVDDKMRVIIQGGHYAVFSYPRPADDRTIPLLQRMLSRYVFQEWVPVNRKVTNTMGFTYERFTRDRVYLYLPVKSGMDIGSELKTRVWGVAQWAHHIDDLIDVDLNADVLADLEGYSAKNYVDVFSMYYGVTPSAYIRRRRLYLAGEELRSCSSEECRDTILARYRFSSYAQFLRVREKEFGVVADADAVDAVAQGGSRHPDALSDLEAFYESNKERVAYWVRHIPDFRILGHSIEESYDGRQPHDLVGRVLYWFQQTFPGFEDLESCFTPDGRKVFIWADECEYSYGPDGASVAEGEVSRYYVARILRSSLDDREKSAVDVACEEAGAHSEVVSGGCYAVFWTVDDLELYSLEDAFNLLTRCAFGGWIKDNRWRVDLTRRTFVTWRERKLYFYVPTVG